jgi:hypothetical protein
VVPCRIGTERPAEPATDVTRAGVVALAIGVLALTGCGGGSGKVATRGPSTTVSTMPPGGGGPSVTVGIICMTPTDAAQAVVSAWQASDATAAARCASAAAVSTLFARPGHGTGWTLQGCDGPDPGVPICTFAYAGGHASFTLQGTEAQGWKVGEVAFSP